MINLNLYKDLLYLVGSTLGIITFFLTVRKRDKSVFTYRTEMGNESYPMLICIRGDMYNVRILNNGKSHYTHKLPVGFKFSSVRRNEYEKDDLDESSFYASLKEGEALLIDNVELNISMRIDYEDQFRNRYFQTFNIERSQIGDPIRFEKNRSQSLYKLSKRTRRFLWIWF